MIISVSQDVGLFVIIKIYDDNDFYSLGISSLTLVKDSIVLGIYIFFFLFCQLQGIV